MRAESNRRLLVYLVPGFPANEGETHWVPPIQNFIKAVIQRNPHVDVHVISFHYPDHRGTYRWNGAMVHALGGMNKRFPLRFVTWMRAARQVQTLMKAGTIVTLHSHWLAECTYVAGWLARTTGARHVATIHGQDALPANPYLRHFRFERMIVTAVSENAAMAFSKSTGRRVNHTIPTGLDYSARTLRDWLPERTIDILGVGSLIPLKGFREFLEIVRLLSAEYPALRCMIIGDGPERAALEKQIQRNEMSGVVTLAGALPRESVLKTMRTAKILLHTSHYEGQGYVFLEALAAGMRVVSFDVGYAGRGEAVYRCGSIEDMLQTLRCLLASPLDEISVEVESIDETAAAFESIYGIR